MKTRTAFPTAGLITSLALGAGCVGTVMPDDTRGPVAPRPDPDPGEGPPKVNVNKPPSGLPIVIPDVPASCTTPLKIFSAARPLTRREYNNTVRDLFPGPFDAVDLAASWPAAGALSGFDNDYEGLALTPQHVDQFIKSAERVAQTVVDGGMVGQLACPLSGGSDACAHQFIDAFGRRAYRRPPTDDERASLRAVYAAGRKLADFKTSIRMVIEAALQSPNFILITEVGFTQGAQPGQPVALTDHEVATRLSYFLWGTMPDAQLSGKADAGQLRTPEQVGSEARRLLRDPRARGTVASFHRQWLELGLLGAVKRTNAVPFDAAAGAAMTDGMSRLLEHIVLESPKGTIEEMFSADFAFVNKTTAPFWGLDAGRFGAAFEKVAADPSRRAGLLTDVALLTRLSKPFSSNPVARGKFVRERILCQHLPMPAADVPEIEGIPPNLTTREVFQMHANHDACRPCHSFIDPIGLTFENYDNVGRYRTKENNRTIDASGALTATDVDGPVADGVELARKLSRSHDVAMCVNKLWFRFAFGRSEREGDECTIASMFERFKGRGFRVQDLLLAVVETPAFRLAPGIDAANPGRCAP
jgi:hypothetical protein